MRKYLYVVLLAGAFACLLGAQNGDDSPPLGLPPVFDPIVDATTVPLVIFQAERSGNRWQFEDLAGRLEGGGARVHARILPGVTGLFYDDDAAPETLGVLRTLPGELVRAIELLAASTAPQSPEGPAPAVPVSRPGLDMGLQVFQGNPVPQSLDLEDSEGRRVRYDDYEGMVTVVNFWATWCGPCVEEIPSLNRLRERMRDRHFRLVSVDYAEQPGQVRAFMEKVRVDFPVLMDSDGATAARWGVLVFPATFVIGADGRIAYGVTGAIHWDDETVVQALERLLDTGR